MMYRIEIKHEDKALAFGYDAVLGEFLTIWRRPVNLKERAAQDAFGCNPEELLYDGDSRSGMTKDIVLSELAKHGFAWSELESACRAREAQENHEIAKAIQDINRGIK